MKLSNFLAKNGFIRSYSELRKIIEQEGVYINDELAVDSYQDICLGDILKIGKSEIKVFDN